MAGGKIRHMFPGGNTPQGFFSYYDYVMPVDATRIFILKGDPGVGKSSFMEKIGQAVAERGYALEHHHSASDPNSLDGLVIPEFGVALVDGTSPHIVDPKHPGGVDEILNLGECGNAAKRVCNKAELLACTEEISKRFQRAYQMLSAAKAIYDDWEAANSGAMNYNLANQKVAAVLELLFGNITTVGYGQRRQLFASGITPLGPVNYVDSISAVLAKHYIITGLPGTGKATLLAKVADTAIAKGLTIECYYCPLDPQKIEHIVIPALDTALMTSTPPHNLNAVGATAVVDMNDCLDTAIISRLETVTDYDRRIFWELFSKAIAYLREAKKLHDELKSYYIPTIDYSAVDALREKTLLRIMEYAVKQS